MRKSLNGLAKGAAMSAVKLMPTALRRRLRRGKVTILLYHEITPDLFAQHLDWLSDRYSIIPLRDFADAFTSGTLDALPRDPLVITFDDGWRSNLDLLPVIEARVVPVTIFLPTGIIGTRRRIWNYTIERRGADRALNDRLKTMPNAARLAWLSENRGLEPETEFDEPSHLTWREVEQMARAVDFQSHGLFHPVLPRCSTSEQEREARESKAEIEKRLGDCYAFAYPYGRNDAACRAIVAEAGYTIARANLPSALASRSDDPFAIPAVGVPEGSGVSDLARCITKAEARTLLQRT